MKNKGSKENILKKIREALSHPVPLPFPQSEGSQTVFNSNEEELEVCVHDTGPGIPKGIRSKIFNPFFTTKADRTGIGLYIVQLIIYEHDGVIFLKDDEHGATFIIKMPKKIAIHGKGSLL